MARQVEDRPKGWRLRICLAAAFASPLIVVGQEPRATRAPSRVASVDPLSRKSSSGAVPASAQGQAIERAIAAITSCKRDFAKITDYTCTFFKRERIGGKLLVQNVMVMKARTTPTSFYFKFLAPDAGREAIFVAGSHTNKAVVHDVGFGKLLAGTLKLDPRGRMAMEDCRHPITDAGIGHMIETIDTAWAKELNTEDSRIVFHEGARVGDRPCMMIESIHPEKKPNFLFHMVRVYIDTEHNLPIRFEAYDWPRAGQEPELLEEYIYSKLKLNVGLQDADFDPANASYSFGRF